MRRLSRDEAVRLMSGLDEGPGGNLSAEARRALFAGELAYESAYGHAQRKREEDKQDKGAPVQHSVQRDAVRPEFGSTPHDDRVLAIVLVVTGGDKAPDVEIVRVDPNSPHAEAFWQDIGRAAERQPESPEVPVADETVQRDGPTRFAVPLSPLAWWSEEDEREYQSWANPERLATRCNDFWREHARQDLIERLSPLDEPIPRREP